MPMQLMLSRPSCVDCQIERICQPANKAKIEKKIHSGEALDVHCKKRFEHPYNGCTDRSNNFELSLVSADQSPRISRDRKHTLASTATDI